MKHDHFLFEKFQERIKSCIFPFQIIKVIQDEIISVENILSSKREKEKDMRTQQKAGVSFIHKGYYKYNSFSSSYNMDLIIR